MRVQISPDQYRAETIILPLIDNSIYTGMAMAFGGKPEPLDALPVPKRNIFSLAMCVNKQELFKHKPPVHGLLNELGLAGIGQRPGTVTLEEFLLEGIGNQVGMHVYDATPMFDFNLTGFLGDMMGRFRGAGRGMNDEMLPVSFLIASLNAPVYLSLPVKDARVVDKFLEELDLSLAMLARRPQRDGWFRLDHDFYQFPAEKAGQRFRCYSVAFGPVKWRMFFTRLGDGLYIASKPFILEDLAAAAEGKPAEDGPIAHAMVRARPANWNQVLPQFRLSWEERSREACLNNLGPLSSVARAVSASGNGTAKPEEICCQADALHAVHFFCPDGGRYEVLGDGKQTACSIHGAAHAPRQLAAPTSGSPMGRLMRDFGGLTAQLTFLEDGLHAVVTVQRKP